jgi:hypothetical protein
MSSMTCSQCGSTELEPGFLEDLGQGAWGHVRWIAGPLERGIFGGAKRMGRPRREVAVYRCLQCAHLELFAS